MRVIYHIAASPVKSVVTFGEIYENNRGNVEDTAGVLS